MNRPPRVISEDAGTPKRIKRLLREHAELAHEEELRRALLPLAAAFDEWKAGRLSSGELSDRIYEFHQGPSRELFSRYDNRWLDMPVAYAIVRGILDKTQVPPELLDYLQRHLAFYESQETA
jgi:hypothetical protein